MMFKVSPKPIAEDPPPLVNGESATLDKKNNVEKFRHEESREVEMTRNNFDEVKNGFEIGTEGIIDMATNIVEADDANASDSGCASVVSAEVVKMANTHHEANIEGENVKMVGTKEVEMVHTQHEAEEDAYQDKDGKNGDNQHDVDIKMVDTKAGARNSEEKNMINIKIKELIVRDKDEACHKKDKKVKNKDIQCAKKVDGEDMTIVEGKTDARIEEAIENKMKGEMEDNAEENKNIINIDAENVIMVDKKLACQNRDM